MTGLMISVEHLRKEYQVMVHSAGWRGLLQDVFHRQYQYVPAVDGITFSIQPGEIVGFIGPNGAGKTTTVKLLSGLLRPTAGSIVVNGHDPFQRHPQFLRSIGVVMGKRSQLWWDLDAFHAVELVSRAYGVEREEFERRLHALASLLEVTPQLARPVRSLSLGQRVKFELIASLIHGPEVLFLDEPTLGLDLVSQRALRKFLLTCNEYYGTTILLTSHYMRDIEELCSRVLIIHEGKLVFDGSLPELSSASRAKRVRIEAPATCAGFRQPGLSFFKERGLWMGTVTPDKLRPILHLAMEIDATNLVIEEPPLEDVVIPYLQGQGADS